MTTSTISVDSIINSVNNPRKQFGDLTELRDSVEKNGILQPITVVQEDDHYKVIMGHRRLEAARLAGLTEVPCIVRAWDDAEQINVMMMENMMRENLTTYEEAKGFQMMLDLGKSVEDIAGETGFSTSTVRSRTKLLSLDEEKFKESVARGATLQDLTKLYQIEDEHTRNAALKFAGTAEFNAKIQKAVAEQERDRKMTAALAVISEKATKIETRGLVDGQPVPMYYYAGYDIWINKIPELESGNEYYFTADQYCIRIFAKGEDTAEADRKAKEEELRKIEQYLSAIASSAYALRLEFIRNFGNFRKYGKTIMRFFMQACIEDMSRSSWRNSVLAELGGVIQIDNLTEDLSALDDIPMEKLALSMLSALNDSERACPWERHWMQGGWEYHYEKNDALIRWYDFLSSIGYRISEDEKNFLDGAVQYVIHPEEITEEAPEVA